MKKMLSILCVLLVSIIGASAIEVDCQDDNKPGCKETELDEEFDELEAQINETNKFISDRSERWSMDSTGGGTSFKRVLAYLTGDYVSFIRNIIRAELVEYTKVVHGDCPAAKLKAAYSGNTEKVNGVFYNPKDNLGCISFN